MLDKLMESFGGDVINQITEKAGISADQAKQVLPIAQESLQSGLMEQVTGGNVDGILGMFNSAGGDGLMSNSLFSGIKAQMMKGVMTKMGLPESVAGMVAGTGMSSIIGNLAGKLGGAGSIDSAGLMSGLGLGGGGGLMDMATNMAKDKMGDLGGLGDKAGDVGGGLMDKLGDAAKDGLGDKLGDIAGGLFGKK